VRTQQTEFLLLFQSKRPPDVNKLVPATYISFCGRSRNLEFTIYDFWLYTGNIEAIRQEALYKLVL